MRRKALFYVLLAAATVSLSHLLGAWRAWRAVPTPGTGAEAAASALAVAGAMLWLGFLLYEVDRAAGRVRHRVGIYEWVLARQPRAVRPEWGWRGAAAAREAPDGPVSRRDRSGPGDHRTQGIGHAPTGLPGRGRR